jgi:branched-chain amino acid transport system permease protein
VNQGLLLAVNSIAFGGLLFLLASGFSLIFGLMRIPNLTHGSFFMLGAYFGISVLGKGPDPLSRLSLALGIARLPPDLAFWLAALVAAAAMAALGGVIERLLLRRLAGQELAQVLVTLGLSFIISDLCLMTWAGDPIPLSPPPGLRGAIPFSGFAFPVYRLAMVIIAVVVAAALWLMLDRTRLGAMIRAGVDDPVMARVAGIPVSRLFTLVFCLGAGLAGFAGVIGALTLSVAPGLDTDMLPLALIVVILGGTGSLPGALVGSFVIAFLDNFGKARYPELAYFMLFLPMLLILLLRPQGLFGRRAP